MTEPTPEELVTRLAGGPPLTSHELEAIPADQWEVVADRAAEHRLEPLLHFRFRTHTAVPEAIGKRWAEGYRAAAIAALAHKAELLRLATLFAEHGIASIALKGSWLAWHVYPQAALRPLRDIDLLVLRKSALEARALLIERGWTEDDTDGLGAEEWLTRFKHLPPLVSQEGIVLELHTRLWDDDGRTPPQPVGLFERAVRDAEHPALAYPAPEDMLMHLAVHAAFHRFDGGPLMLVDFDRLAARVKFDWDAVWQRAEVEGWDRPLSLAIAATRRWGSTGLVNVPALPLEPPAEVLDALPALLAKPLEMRASDIAAAKRARSDVSLADKLRKAIARRERFATTREWLGWVREQLAAKGDGRLEAMAAMDAWLVG